jgi:hypothetical protein
MSDSDRAVKATVWGESRSSKTALPGLSRPTGEKQRRLMRDSSPLPDILLLLSPEDFPRQDQNIGRGVCLTTRLAPF